MKIIKIFFCILLAFVLSFCSSDKSKLQIDIGNHDNKFDNRLKFDIQIDTIVKQYFNAVNKYGKDPQQAYKMIIECDESNNIEILMYSFISNQSLNNIKPIGWYQLANDTLLIYSSIDKIGIYDSCAYEIQKKISQKLIPDSVVVQFDPLAWKILLRNDSIIVYKSPSQWAKPRKKEVIKFE